MEIHHRASQWKQAQDLSLVRKTNGTRGIIVVKTLRFKPESRRFQTQSQFYGPEPLIFFQVAPHLSSQGLSGPRCRPTATQKICAVPGIEPGNLSLQPGPQRRSLNM
jgi:hypothetical protein